MKKGFLLAGFIAGLVLANSSWALEAYISGKVTNESTNAAIAGAIIKVHLNPYSSTHYAGGYSNLNGDYLVKINNTTLPETTVYVWCYAQTYKPEWWDNALLPSDADSFRVTNGDTVYGIDFALAPMMDSTTGLRGRVKEQNTMMGINDALVVAYVYPDTDTVVAHTFTGQMMGYYFLPVSANQYYVRAGKNGYKPEWFDEGNLQIVTVTSGIIELNINFTLEAYQQGAICGAVLKESDNSAISSAIVVLHNSSQTPIDTTYTGNYGGYKFASVAAGTYYVTALAHGFKSEWWDNEELPQNADSIVVTNSPVSHINFYLADTLDKGAVGGVVTNTSNDSIQGAQVRILGTYLGAYTDYHGKYKIKDVPVGSYSAVAKAIGYYPDTNSFSVTTNTLTTVNFELIADTFTAGSISGRVTEQSNDTVGIWGAGVAVFPESASYPVAWTHTGHYGRYKVQNLQPGDYHVRARASGYEKEWYYESPTRTGATIVPVVSNQNTPEINFTLDSLPKGGISGTVLDTAGNGIPLAFVKAQGINNWFHNHTFTNIAGDYLIEDLIPGLYKVGAIAFGYLPNLYPQPVPVIADSTTPGIDIVLKPIPSYSGWISGKVTDDSSNAIPFALVMAISTPSSPHHVVRHDFTNLNGEYKVRNLPDATGNRYFVLAIASSYIPEFYDNKQSWLTADTVDPNSAGINFALGGSKDDGDKGPMAISGRIAQAKAGIPDAIIYAIDNGQRIGAARSLDDGSYLMSDLPPGTYNLEVTAVGYEDMTYGPVSVVEENVAGVDIELQTYGTEEPISPEKKALWLSVAPTIINHNATISYNIPTDTHVELSVYDVSGRKAVTLVNSKLKAGTHYAILNTNEFAQGIYFVKLNAGGEQLVRKLILIQ